jgi:citrate synthase
MFYLLLTGRYPKDEELHELQKDWRERGEICENTKKFIMQLPRDYHPMTMLSMALLYLQPHSKFYKAYQAGASKTYYWESYYEDAMDLLAKMPSICATIYRHKYRASELIPSDPSLDWAGNLSHMLGYQSNGMKECLRGYLSIHSDHEGGNVSAHVNHLVGSALADPYLSYSAAMDGLAGPLHGLANQ